MGSPTMPTTKREKRDRAVAELLSSETDYVSDLKLLVDVFLLPLEKWAKDLKAQKESDVSPGGDISADHWAADFTQQDCNNIFGNILQLAHFNRQFLHDLQKAHGGPFETGGVGAISPVSSEGWWRKVTAGREGMEIDSGHGDPFKARSRHGSEKGPRQMLEVFLKSAPFLKMYSEYVNNFDSAQDTLTRLETDNLSFNAFLTACEKQKPCRGLHLRDFLILPLQRIPRYRMLLETILENTEVESTMHSKVEQSLSTMGGIASKIDNDVSLQQRKNKVFELQQEFGGADFVTASRLFVREGDLSKVAKNGVEKLHFVLFNDLLVYGQAKRKRRGALMSRGGSGREQLYHHRRGINLAKCFIVDAPSYGDRCYSFLGETGMMVVSEEKAFMLMATSAVEKDGWLQAMRRCMRELNNNSHFNSNGQIQLQHDEKGEPHRLTSSGDRWSGSPDRWSLTPARSPLSTSAPRSVWVPGKPRLGSRRTSPTNSANLRLVHFSLPAWAGVRASCGCLSHTELVWGKEGLWGEGWGAGGGAAAGSAGGARGMVVPSPQAGYRERGSSNTDTMLDQHQSGGAPQPSGDSDIPTKMSIVVAIDAREKMGLRVRDVHPECGGGVVVVGFQRSAAGKKAGVLQGDRITQVDGVLVSKAADVVWALQRQPSFDSNAKSGSIIIASGRREVHLAILRGFPNSDRPWMPRLMVEPSPTAPDVAGGSAANATPPSSFVYSPGSSNDENDFPVPSPELSAPGRKTFSGIGRSGNNTLGFAGYSGSRGSGAAAAEAVEPPLSAATATEPETDEAEIFRAPPLILPASPPSPETATAPGAATLSDQGHRRAFGRAGASGLGSATSPLRPAAAAAAIAAAASAPAAPSASGSDGTTPVAELTIKHFPSTATAATAGMDSSSSSWRGGLTATEAVEPSPSLGADTRADEELRDAGDGADGGGSSSGTGADSTDSTGGGGRALRGPAPTQANVNAGGDPAVPFAAFRGGSRAAVARGQAEGQQEQEREREQEQGQEEEKGKGKGKGQGQGQRSGRAFLGLEVGNALAACWSSQVYDDDDENSRPVEFDLKAAERQQQEEEEEEQEEVPEMEVRKPPAVLLADLSRGTSASTVVGMGSAIGDEEGRRGAEIDDDDDYEDHEEVLLDRPSAVSGSSSAESSLFLAALSPSRRVPPPLMSVASTLPLPPVSMASSVVSGSSSNPWLSPTPAPPGEKERKEKAREDQERERKLELELERSLKREEEGKDEKEKEKEKEAPKAEDEDLDSMAWLQPLPSPPPRGATPSSSAGGPSFRERWGRFAGAPSSSSSTAAAPAAARMASEAAPPMAAAPTPPPTRGRMELAYPSGRWVQTPPRGELLEVARAEPKDGEVD